MDFYIWGKALHLVAVIYWMAGLLYLPRLYVYHSKAVPGGELEAALLIQERRLLKIIMNPAMIVAFILGLYLVGKNISMGTIGNGAGGWLIAKLFLVFGLMGYHMVMAGDRKKFERGERPRSEKTYRMLNEIPALVTIPIVIFAIVKPF